MMSGHQKNFTVTLPSFFNLFMRMLPDYPVQDNLMRMRLGSAREYLISIREEPPIILSLAGK
jgi:hypothetical protein